jgi:hypothetical protein
MPITLVCSCGKHFKVLDELAGKRVKCPGCQEIVEVPGGAEEEAAADDEDVEAQPRKKKKQPEAKSRAGLCILVAGGVLVLGFCCLGVGGAAVYWFVLRSTPEKTMIGRWQLDIQEHLKKEPGFLLEGGTTPTVEFRADGSVIMGPAINRKWKHIKTDGDTVTLEIDGQQATVKVLDSNRIQVDSPWLGRTLYLKRIPGS